MEEFNTWNSTDANADEIAEISIFGGSYRNRDWRAQFKDPKQLFHSAYKAGDRGVYVNFKKKCRFNSFNFGIRTSWRRDYQVRIDGKI